MKLIQSINSLVETWQFLCWIQLMTSWWHMAWHSHIKRLMILTHGIELDTALGGRHLSKIFSLICVQWDWMQSLYQISNQTEPTIGKFLHELKFCVKWINMIKYLKKRPSKNFITFFSYDYACFLPYKNI